jgi:hypothetical protein
VLPSMGAMNHHHPSSPASNAVSKLLNILRHTSSIAMCTVLAIIIVHTAMFCKMLWGSEKTQHAIIGLELDID